VFISQFIIVEILNFHLLYYLAFPCHTRVVTAQFCLYTSWQYYAAQSMTKTSSQYGILSSFYIFKLCDILANWFHSVRWVFHWAIYWGGLASYFKSTKFGMRLLRAYLVILAYSVLSKSNILRALYGRVSLRNCTQRWCGGRFKISVLIYRNLSSLPQCHH